MLAEDGRTISRTVTKIALALGLAHVLKFIILNGINHRSQRILGYESPTGRCFEGMETELFPHSQCLAFSGCIRKIQSFDHHRA